MGYNKYMRDLNKPFREPWSIDQASDWTREGTQVC